MENKAEDEADTQNRENGGKSSCALKLIKNITVEPILVCYLVPSVLAMIAVQNLNLEKACRVNENYGDEICTSLINQQTENYTKELIQVHTLVANMSAWKYPLLTSIPALLIVFIGAWSDRTGLRRPCMLMPIIGEFLTSIGLILCTFYFLEWPLEVAGIIEALPPALTGGWTTMFMAVFSYISDITSLENRTFRIGVVNIFLNVGIPIGSALGGLFTKLYGFYGVFLISIAFYVIGFVYGIIRIKDTRKINDEKTDKSACRQFFSFKHVSDTVMVAFKPRAGSRRLRIILLMLIFVTLTGPIYGETTVVYLFTRFKYNFNEVEYSFFTTYSVTINLIGTIIAITLFSKYFKMSDSLIGAISGVSKIAASFIYAFAPTKTIFYLAPIVDLLSGTGIIAMRSIASKLVEPNETGKIHSLFGVCEAIVPIIYSPMYTRTYISTIQNIPGAFYLLGGMLMIPSVIVFIGMYYLERKDLKNEKKDLQKHAYENEVTVF